MKDEKNEIISPLYDFAFTQIFGTRQNLGSTKAFLKTLLDIPEDDYDRLTIEDSTLKRFFKKDKKGVVDLKLTTKSGKIIHIELQVKKKTNLKSRIMYYAGRLLGDQLKWGIEYEKLQQVVSICICDHVLLEEEDAYVNKYELRNDKGRRFTDLLKVVILELPKLTEREDEAVWPWMQFFKCKKQEEFEMLARKHPELKEAVSCVKKMSSFSDRWRWTMLTYQGWKMDRQGEKEQMELDLAEARTKALAEGHAEGHAKGHTEGHAEGQTEKALEIARKMKKMDMPVSQIAEITGLSPEEVVSS
jgi:predicted transposase/invertase (TIGR01784 family)